MVEGKATEDAGWTPARSAAGDRSPWLLTGVVSLATFMVVLDSTIVNVALPNIAGSLGISVRDSTWVLTAFLIANAIIIPVSSWLSDVIGRKRYYTLSVALFTLASFLCALAPNLSTLVFFRVLQGLAGGGLAVSEQSMLADSFPPSKRGMAFAAYSVVVIIGPVLGPTVGGYITDTISWHWVFLINVPVGLLSIFLVGRFVVDSDALIQERAKRLARGVSVDYIGLILVALGLGSLTYVLSEGQDKNWFDDSRILGLSVVTVASLAALVWWELRHPDPVVRLRLLANRQLAIVTGVIFVVGFLLFSTTEIIPQMFQAVFGYTALESGLALTLGGVGLLLVLPAAGRLAGKVDPRWLLIPALTAIALGVWHFTLLTTQASFQDLALARLYQTIALPFVFVTINTIAYVGLKPTETGDASALLNVFRNIGGTVGIAISQTILISSSQVHQSKLTERANLLNPEVRDLLLRGQQFGLDASVSLELLYAEILNQAAFLAYLDVFRFLALTIVVAIPFCLFVRRGSTGDAGHGAG